MKGDTEISANLMVDAFGSARQNCHSSPFVSTSSGARSGSIIIGRNAKGPSRLSLSSHEPEGTPLRVLADGEAVSRVDHSALKLHHSLKSPRDVVHDEIWQ